MQNIKNFISKAKQAIATKTTQDLNSIQNSLTTLQSPEPQHEGQLSVTQNHNGIQQQDTPAKQLIQDQKVLQIDVIQSGYIPKTQEELPVNAQVTQSQASHQKLIDRSVQNEGTQQASKLKRIQEEKLSILEQLKKLDNQIAEIKGQEVQDGAMKRRQKQQEQQQATKHAKDLVKHLKQQKKEIEERKRKEAQKAYQLLKEQEEERKARQVEQKERAKSEKRRKIQARMEEEKRKKQERKLIEKESNRLLKQLKKEQIVLKQKEELPLETGEIQQKKKVIEKKNDVDFREIQEHERRYIQRRQNDRNSKKQRAESVNHQVPQYKKNMWLEQIEEQQMKKRQEEVVRQSMRKGQLQKRKKYGELVKNIFIPKQSKKDTFEEDPRDKPTTPDTNLLPRIPQSQKRVTDSKHLKKFAQNNRPFATAHNPKPPRPHKLERLQKKQSQNIEVDKQRKQKEVEMRRQTRERLKKIEGKSMDLPRSLDKPKYQNYLGKVNVKAENQVTSWKKIIDNESISKEDKYKQMLMRANAMENKAKVKEEVKKDGDDEAVNLYIGSIQAKLAILQKF